MLDGLLHPPIALPRISRCVAVFVLYTASLLSRDSCERAFISQLVFPVQLLQQSKICPWSVFHSRRTHRTSPPPGGFPVFGPPKEAMGGEASGADEVVPQAGHEWPRSQSK